MRIERNNVKGATRSYGVSRGAGAPAASSASAVSGTDKVDVSDRVRQAGAIHEKLVEAPQMRAHLVERLREQIDAGTYKPDSRQVADRLLKAKVLDE